MQLRTPATQFDARRHRGLRWICAWLLCGWFGAALASLSNGEAADWKLSAQRVGDGTDGVEVYTRSVPNSAYDETRVVASVCAPIDALATVLTDASHFDQWIPDTEHAQQLAAPSQFERIYYIRTGMPWPIKDRDMVYRIVSSANPETAAALTVTLEGLPDYLPPVDGVVRMVSVQGRWQLARIGSRTHIELEMRIEPGGGVPAWLAQRRIVGTPAKMVLNIGRLFAGACPSH